MQGVLKDIFARATIGSAVAFVGAIPMAGAAGFYQGDIDRGNQGVAVFCAAVILFLLTCALLTPATRAVASALSALAHAPSRPGPTMALAMIGCGTFCVALSLWGAWSLGSADGSTSAVRQLQHSMVELRNRGFENVNLNVNAPHPAAFGPMILTTMGFFLGAVMIGVGVWSNFSGADMTSNFAYGNGYTKMAPIPAADETRL